MEQPCTVQRCSHLRAEDLGQRLGRDEVLGMAGRDPAAGPVDAAEWSTARIPGVAPRKAGSRHSLSTDAAAERHSAPSTARWCERATARSSEGSVNVSSTYPHDGKRSRCRASQRSVDSRWHFGHERLRQEWYA
jgi:hypothetical protein